MNFSKNGPEIAAAILVAALGLTTSTISGSTESTQLSECNAPRVHSEKSGFFSSALHSRN
jgi:hypothetical protein